MMGRKRAVAAAAYAGVFLLLAACGSPANPQTSPASAKQTEAPAAQAEQAGETNRIKASVVQVIDGDTIKVKLNGKEETVRFLLVDTPETHHPKLGEQPFGKEASDFTKALLTDKTVELEQDVSPGPDKYGRYLYYIYIDGKSVQEMLLEKGLARVAYIYVPNVKYVDRYRAIQEKAQQAGVGIWSVENYAREDGYHPEAVGEAGKQGKKESKNPNVTSPSKQAVPPSGAKQTSVYYASCKEARAAGAAPLHKGEPGYRPEMDGDKDGIACE
ncbi:thermonuclease family protein [Brevibacillus fluminis]|uniref:thermonuclease family protein n=1 Tax=Brevibacillus fluminis TaxID=511487 RepID=UPI003F88BB90